MKPERIKILSAIGSKYLPKLVWNLYFRAIYPSKKSDKEQIKKIMKDITLKKYVSINIKKIKTNESTILRIDKKLGINLKDII